MWREHPVIVICVWLLVTVLLLGSILAGRPPNVELAKRQEREAIKECVDAGGIVELLYYEGPGTYYLHACNLTPGRVEVR